MLNMKISNLNMNLTIKALSPKLKMKRILGLYGKIDMKKSYSNQLF